MTQAGLTWDEVKENPVSDWYLPGQGEKYPTCGTIHFQGCLDTQHHLHTIDPTKRGKAYIKIVKHNCGRAQCPICSRKWMVEATKNIEHRISEGRPERFWNPIHVTVSPQVSEWEKFENPKEYAKLRRKATRIAKKAGMDGFVIIPHPYRQKKLSKLWRKSPHFHLLGYGWIDGTKEIYEKTGWIVKNHRIRKSVGATAYYQLSHSGVKQGNHTISWCGSLAWNKIRIPRIRKERQMCPICGAPIMTVSYYGIHFNPLAGKEKGCFYVDSDGWRYKARYRL